ncbi:MAG: hypothetical protein ACFFDS_09485 [Candidatus Thorarchaeota archaeon]
MKKFEFLALKPHEFIEMVDTITRERVTLKVKKKTENTIKVSCQVGLPIAFIQFKANKIDKNLEVERKLNWFPLIYSTLPLLLALIGIVYLIQYFTSGITYFIYILICLAWLLALGFLIYQIYSELEEINKKLFRIEV